MRLTTTAAIGLTLCLVSTLVLASAIRPVRSDPPVHNTDTGPVHNIDTGLNYTTINDAIYAPETDENHTIMVDPGTYQENVWVPLYGLKIIGQNPATTIIDAGGMNEVIWSFADNITISGFTIRNGYTGIHVDYYVNYNTFTGNNITSNWDYGIYLEDGSANNVFVGNNITQNNYGIFLWNSNTNKVHHNNFINNQFHVDVTGSGNLWDNGYPSGGNYWSNYTGVDLKSGPNQDQPGSDGIGDAPHNIDANNQDRYPFMNIWTPQAHDIGIVNVVQGKTVVGQGYTMRINVTVTNQGSYTQTFNVTAYADTTIAETKTATLTSKSSTTLILTWNTTGSAKGDHTISAQVPPVPGEMDTSDNSYTDGTVKVGMTGDINLDGRVNIIDLATIGIAYGSRPGDPVWNPNADISDNWIVDIADLAICARSYGKIDP